jgi:hypothetical protein
MVDIAEITRGKGNKRKTGIVEIKTSRHKHD